MRLRRFVASAIALLMVGGLIIAGVTTANAAVVRAFTPYFNTQTNGAISITGNGLLTCSPSAACTAAQNNDVATQGNNQFQMVFLDTDDDPTTTSSSGATVRIPDGSRVLYAGLFWGAAQTAGAGGRALVGPREQLKLRVPGATSYQTVTATRPVDVLSTGNRDYSAYADITSRALVGACTGGQTSLPRRAVTATAAGRSWLPIPTRICPLVI